MKLNEMSLEDVLDRMRTLAMSIAFDAAAGRPLDKHMVNEFRALADENDNRND